MDDKTLKFAIKTRDEKIRLLEQITKNQKTNINELKKELKSKDELISELQAKINELSVIERLSSNPIKPKSYAQMMKAQGRW